MRARSEIQSLSLEGGSGAEARLGCVDSLGRATICILPEAEGEFGEALLGSNAIHLSPASVNRYVS